MVVQRLLEEGARPMPTGVRSRGKKIKKGGGAAGVSRKEEGDSSGGSEGDEASERASGSSGTGE